MLSISKMVKHLRRCLSLPDTKQAGNFLPHNSQLISGCYKLLSLIYSNTIDGPRYCCYHLVSIYTAQVPVTPLYNLNLQQPLYLALYLLRYILLKEELPIKINSFP